VFLLHRVVHPGLCAEEYQHMMELVIRYLFNWDVETQKRNGVGLFATILAWCLATEEQGQNRCMATTHCTWKTGTGSWTYCNRGKMKYVRWVLGLLQLPLGMPRKCWPMLAVHNYFLSLKSGKHFATFLFFHPRCQSDRNPKEI
jgi:hypothetical protein